MKASLKTFLLGTLVFFTSCVKDINFNQVKDLELTPGLAIALAKFEFKQVDLIDKVTNKEKLTFSDTASFSVFNSFDESQKKYLRKVSLLLDIKNEFSRTFELDFSLLDADGATTYTLNTLVIKPEDTYNTPTEIAIVDHPNFLNSTTVAITMRLLPSTTSPINVNVPKKFVFKSSGVFHFRIH